MSGKPVDLEHCSRIACEWTVWARAPNHDAFWAYRTSLISFIGHGTGDSLAVGSGEGRVSRVLKECGYRGGAPFVLQKSYFGRERFEDTEVRNG